MSDNRTYNAGDVSISSTELKGSLGYYLERVEGDSPMIPDSSEYSVEQRAAVNAYRVAVKSLTAAIGRVLNAF